MNEYVKGKAQLAWEDGKHGVICGKSVGKLIAIVGNNPDDGLNDVRKANAERIVHTWNCHDDLVKALEELRNCINETRSKPSYEAVKKADAVLNKAKQEQL